MYPLKGLPNNSTPVYWLSYSCAGLNIYTGRMPILLLGICSLTLKLWYFPRPIMDVVLSRWWWYCIVLILIYLCFLISTDCDVIFVTVCLPRCFVNVPRGSNVIMGQGADIINVISGMICVTNLTSRSYKGLSYWFRTSEPRPEQKHKVATCYRSGRTDLATCLTVDFTEIRFTGGRKTLEKTLNLPLAVQPDVEAIQLSTTYCSR